MFLEPMATQKSKWTANDEKQLHREKNILRKARDKISDTSDMPIERKWFRYGILSMDYNALKKQKLGYLMRFKVKDVLADVGHAMNAQDYYSDAYYERQEASSKVNQMENNAVGELHSMLTVEKCNSQSYENELNQIRGKVSIWRLYDHILYCRYKIVPEVLPNTELTDEVAIKLYKYANILHYILQNQLARSDITSFPDGIYDKEEQDTLGELHTHFYTYNTICTILYTVLTLKTLSEEDRKTFQQHLEIVKMHRMATEDKYILKRFVATAKCNEVDYENEDHNKFMDDYEQLFMGFKAAGIINYLHAVTVLHHNRKTRYPVLNSTIDFFQHNIPQNSLDEIRKAIDILQKQNINKMEFRSISPLSSIGLISERLSDFSLPTKKWYWNKRYLYIEKSSVVDFPVYIDRLEIDRLIQIITEQFQFDNKGLYREEKNNELRNEPLSSIIIFLAEDTKKNAQEISGTLECGGQKITINDDLYITQKSYQDLEKTTFKRLSENIRKYANWFRSIINGQANGLRLEDEIDRDISILALAKIIAECARNPTTWMINLMCLDLIEKNVTLAEKDEGSQAASALASEKASPWHLFFDYHSMTGGSANKSELNKEEVKKKQLLIVMNWLCNSWPGEEEVSMKDSIDGSYHEQSRAKIQCGDGYYRNIISDMLYYRMNLNVRWDAYYDTDNDKNPWCIKDAPKGRRILGRIYFDDQPLTEEPNNVDLKSQELRLNFLISADKNGINDLSKLKFENWIARNVRPQLHQFYTKKIHALDQRKLDEINEMYLDQNSSSEIPGPQST